MKVTVVALAFLGLIFSACGRREHASPFDAAKPTATASAPAPVAAPLPDSALHVRWGTAQVPPVLTAGSSTPVTVTFTNISNVAWPDNKMADPKGASGAYAVRVGYAWVRAGMTPTDADRVGPRGDLPKPVQPGETVTVPIVITVPATPGEYELTFELVQELLFWFTEKGADTLSVSVRVQAAAK